MFVREKVISPLSLIWFDTCSKLYGLDILVYFHFARDFYT